MNATKMHNIFETWIEYEFLMIIFRMFSDSI